MRGGEDVAVFFEAVAEWLLRASWVVGFKAADHRQCGWIRAVSQAMLFQFACKDEAAAVEEPLGGSLRDIADLRNGNGSEDATRIGPGVLRFAPKLHDFCSGT